MTDTNSKAQVTDEVLNNMLLARAPNRRWTLASLLKENDIGYADRLEYMRAAFEAAAAALAAQEKPEPGVAVKAALENSASAMQNALVLLMSKEVSSDFDYGECRSKAEHEDQKLWSPEVYGLRRSIKEVRSALVSTQAEAPVAWLANCCHCGRIVDTRETKDGGDEFGCQLTDKRWTCSQTCWETTVDPAPSPDLPEGEPVAYHFPGNDREGRQLGYPDELDEGQKANCVPLYSGDADAIAAKDREIAELRARIPAQGEYERQEAICVEAAMSQWERSLKRPDMQEKDRIRGAVEAYKRQAFAFTLPIRSLGKEGSGE